MKKTLLLLVALLLSVSLCLFSCGGKDNDNNQDTNQGENNNPEENNPDEAPQHSHKFGEWITIKKPTCVENGEMSRYCECGEKQTETLYATGEHKEVITSAVAPTCTEAGLTEGKSCSVCKEVLIAQTSVDATGHTEVIDPAVAPSCTETGLTEGKHCSVCNEILVSQGVEPIIAHSYDDKYDESCNACGYIRDAECAHSVAESILGYDATCTEPGLTEGKRCTKCGEILLHQTSIEAKGHTEVTDKAVAASCTKEGLTEGKHCSACQAIIVKQTSVPTIPHTYGEWVVTNIPTCIQDGERERSCECGAKQTEIISGSGMHNEVVDEAVAPTCTKEGLTEGKHCSLCGEVFVEQIAIPMIDHIFDGDGACTVCNYQKYTKGIIYKKSYDGTYAEVTGYNGTSTKIIIADTYEGLPVKTICDEAFRHKETITSVIIPDSITSIGLYAFEGCNSLTGVYITDIVKWCDIDFTSIYANPLYYAKNLYLNNELVTNLVIPFGVTTIEKYAFFECNSLTSVIIPDSVTSIGDRAFQNCFNVASVEISDSVNVIGDAVFRNCKSLTSIAIPNSVTSIGSYAFQRCENLAYVIISNRITTINEATFNSCDSLTSVVIPNNITTIGDYAFGDCESLASVVIPDSVTTIGDYAFGDCESLASVVIPDSVTTIGDYAFRSCESLVSAVIGDSVTTIGDYAFYDCYNLTSVEIGDSVATIGDSAFRGCSGLASVIIPDGVITIGNYVFYECKRLTSVLIPDSITSIGDYAFEGCNSLTDVYITDIVKWCDIDFAYIYSNPLYYATNLYLNNELVTDIVIPSGVINVGSYAFCGFDNLASVVILDSVTTIGDCAFFGCYNLTSVIIPNSVTAICVAAFSYCDGLTDVYYTGSEKEWKKIVIDEGNDYLTGAKIHYNHTAEN